MWVGCAQNPQICGEGGFCSCCRSTACAKGKSLRVIVCFPLLICLWVYAAEAQLPSRKNVIIIIEVGISHPAANLISQELQKAFLGNSERHVEFYMESLDTMTFSDEEAQIDFREALIRQYRNVKIDAIVAMGPGAIRFLAQPRNKLFPGVPVVICCGTTEQAGPPPLGSGFTGAWFDVEPGKTVDAALMLFPQTRNIYVVGGTTAYDRVTEQIIKTKLDSYQGSLTFTYLTNLEMNALLDTLRRLPAQSIVLYTSFWRDGAGNQFINATVALPLISKASNAPVFGMSDTYIGNGVVGGCVVSLFEQTRIVANVLSKVLSGTRAEDIPIVTAPSFFLFDWRELKRWHVQGANLPQGSVVMFREQTLWEQHRSSITAIALVITFLSLLTFYFRFKQRELQLAKNALIKLSGLLIDSEEKERRRLASELHDDFSQRMALLSIGLETVEEMITRAPQQASQQVHELIDSASEIGADLHAVSHRLHSSTLDRLGLLPGVSSFCKEFAAQQRVQVEFRHDSIPRNIPPDTALCLFRVVQEALRNVKKHSGATQAQVILKFEDKSVHLSICDQGIGFDIRHGDRQGLGLLSMAERCRLQGGDFKVSSELHKGTTVHVRLPLQYQPEAVIRGTGTERGDLD
jgi:signal transduction histidine kinase